MYSVDMHLNQELCYHFRLHLLSINAQDIKDVISNFGSCHASNFVAFCLSRSVTVYHGKVGIKTRQNMISNLLKSDITTFV